VNYIASTDRNPFGLSPSCNEYVPGYGDTQADFHVVGNHPGVHGGLATGIPFTDQRWSQQFFETLERGGLVQQVDLDSGHVASYRTFFSYLHMCAPGEADPDADSYATMEPFFDAELRAITAHVLLPVGARATAHVLRNYTAKAPGDHPDMDPLHASEIHGSGWLVVPMKDPAEWTDSDRDALIDRLRSLDQVDFRQVSDLGRFIAGSDPYLVR
jgi:uracil-DNA glycosylase